MSYKYDVHFIGIGGIGMSAIAKHYLAMGKSVSGSDLVCNGETEALAGLGAKVYLGHSEENVDAERVVFSSAVSRDNPELIRARKICRETIERKDALAEILNSHDIGIAVSGIHGKTTTTALLSHMLSERKPTCLIGGVSENINSNYIKGDGNICIAEACEYKRNFLTLRPKIGVVLNVSLDHTDYYTSLEDVENAFISFLAPTKNSGCQVVNADGKNTESLLAEYPKAVTFGIDKGRFRAKNIVCANGKYSFEVYDGARKISLINLPIYGRHNIYNALCCIAICSILGYEKDVLGEIDGFKGIKRRFSFHPCAYTNIIEDYAHHPEEIKSLIDTANTIPHNKLYIVFQPHTYTRTKSLLPLFATAFDGADGLYIAEVYPAREPYLAGGTSLDLYNIVNNRKSISDLRHFDNLETLAAQVRKNAKQNDLVIVTGAGDIDKILPYLSI